MCCKEPCLTEINHDFRSESRSPYRFLFMLTWDTVLASSNLRCSLCIYAWWLMCYHNYSFSLYCYLIDVALNSSYVSKCCVFVHSFFKTPETTNDDRQSSSREEEKQEIPVLLWSEVIIRFSTLHSSCNLHEKNWISALETSKGHHQHSVDKHDCGHMEHPRMLQCLKSILDRFLPRKLSWIATETQNSWKFSPAGILGQNFNTKVV